MPPKPTLLARPKHGSMPTSSTKGKNAQQPNVIVVGDDSERASSEDIELPPTGSPTKRRRDPAKGSKQPATSQGKKVQVEGAIDLTGADVSGQAAGTSTNRRTKAIAKFVLPPFLAGPPGGPRFEDVLYAQKKLLILRDIYEAHRAEGTRLKTLKQDLTIYDVALAKRNSEGSIDTLMRHQDKAETLTKGAKKDLDDARNHASSMIRDWSTKQIREIEAERDPVAKIRRQVINSWDIRLLMEPTSGEGKESEDYNLETVRCGLVTEGLLSARRRQLELKRDLAKARAESQELTERAETLQQAGGGEEADETLARLIEVSVRLDAIEEEYSEAVAETNAVFEKWRLEHANYNSLRDSVLLREAISMDHKCFNLLASEYIDAEELEELLGAEKLWLTLERVYKANLTKSRRLRDQMYAPTLDVIS